VTRLWIDTDIGDDPDDTVALWCAAHATGVELVGISTVDGDVVQRAAIVRELLPSVTVCAGPPDPAQLASVDVLAGIGPWTNVALLAQAGALPRRVVLMGGVLARTLHHDHWRTVEHNVGRDPVAAHDLLATTSDLVIVPLDATAPLVIHADTESALVRAIPLLTQQLADWRRWHGKPVSLVLHDPATVLIAIGEPLARFETRRLQVETDGLMRASITNPSQHVAVHIDGDATRARVRALVSEGD
jgi:inosine-uridine nucleoside N-ribohydrolase